MNPTTCVTFNLFEAYRFIDMKSKFYHIGGMERNSLSSRCSIIYHGDDDTNSFWQVSFSVLRRDIKQYIIINKSMIVSYLRICQK